MKFKYKTDNPDPIERRNECFSIMKKFPDRIPMICEKDPKSKMSDISKTKYLIEKGMTAGQFNYILRNQMTLDETFAFFLFAGDRHIITSDNLLIELYEKFKDPEDGFLYVFYSEEQVWG